MEQKSYIAIDLKSFYASVECVERGLDPLDINLVVADESRTDKTSRLACCFTEDQHGLIAFGTKKSYHPGAYFFLLHFFSFF